ncbi:Translocation protein S62 [Orbilia blumenaviensis]|uniref:Translocation protein SEC62 n=1 Tax=Orbilia blumenaviensis TaxID=1796055 RepID=A0AAV9UJY7_9PEZI
MSGPPPGQPMGPQPPTPEALAVANFLKNSELKPRTSILGGKRVEMFKVKRALRALESPAYAKAQAKKNSNLPPITDRQEAEMAFLLLPRHMMALRVHKIEPQAENHGDHSHGKPKRIKGQWNVQIVPQQAAGEDMYYVWFYEGPQWKRTIIGLGVLILLLGIVMFPLWPAILRLGVWYLSMGMLGLLGLFFLMAIFRLILFVITMFAVPPGLWLYPNLFEDVGFFDSFRPVWAWEKTKEEKKKKKKRKHSHSHGVPMDTPGFGPTPSGADVQMNYATEQVQTSQGMQPRVEEVFDE